MSPEAKLAALLVIMGTASTPWWLLPWVDRVCDRVGALASRRRRMRFGSYRVPGGDR